MVYRCFCVGTLAHRNHGRWFALLQPRDVPIRQGYDAQGVQVELEQYGRHYGQLCQVRVFPPHCFFSWNMLMVAV